MEPLAGFRVLDASRVLAGPYAAMMLGDLGADVIKVEVPGPGDQTRAWGPPFVKGESAYYLAANRNKRSITLNLKAPEARRIFLSLARKSDVVIENFRAGQMERMGLGFGRLSRENPRLVFCSITGYGQTGPWKDRPAYDLALQAETGLMSVTGEEGRAPVRVGVAVIDMIAAHRAVEAILAALLERHRTDRGRRIDVAMLDCGAAFLSYMAQIAWASGKSPGRMGSRHPTIAPYQAFRTKDGHIVVAVGSQEIWGRFCRAVGRPRLAEDPRFAENSGRVRRRESLERILGGVFRARTTARWLRVLQAHDVPASGVNSVAAALVLPPIRSHGLVRRVDHPTIGTLPLVGPPVRFGTVPLRPPPTLGEHTVEILEELGMEPGRIAKLRARGVV